MMTSATNALVSSSKSFRRASQRASKAKWCNPQHSSRNIVYLLSWVNPVNCHRMAIQPHSPVSSKRTHLMKLGRTSVGQSGVIFAIFT